MPSSKKTVGCISSMLTTDEWKREEMESNLWQPMALESNQWKPMETSKKWKGNLWKPMAMESNLMETNGNLWQPNGNLPIIAENVRQEGKNTRQYLERSVNRKRAPPKNLEFFVSAPIAKFKRGKEFLRAWPFFRQGRPARSRGSLEKCGVRFF